MKDEGKPENTEEVIQCRHCDREISAKAKVCWHCGNDQHWLGSKLKYVGLVMVAISVAQVIFIAFKTVDTYKVLNQINLVKDEATTVLTSIQHREKLLNEKLATLSLNVDELEDRLFKNTEKFDKKQNALAKSVEAVRIQAEEKVSKVVDSVKLQAEQSEERLATTEKTFDTKQRKMNEELTVLKADLSGQLKKLQWRDNLMRLADSAISRGNREDYNEILKIQNSTRNNEDKLVASSYVMQVKSFYISAYRYKSYKLDKELDNKEFLDKAETQNLIREMLNNKNKAVRYIIAQYISNRKEVGVLQPLIEVMENDNSLDVLKISVMSFEKLTGFDSGDVFGYKDAIEYWNKNKEEIEKKLKKPEDKTEKPAS